MIRRSTWILLGLFLIVLVFALLLQGNFLGKKAEATSTPGLQNLFDVQGNPVITLKITAASGDSVVMERDVNGPWILIEPAGLEADQDLAQSGVNRTSAISIVSEMETTPDLKAIGLEPPAYRVQLTLADGKQQVAFIGNLTPTGSGYYAHLDGGPLVLVNKYAVEGMLELLKNPPVRPTPTVLVEPQETPTPEP